MSKRKYDTKVRPHDVRIGALFGYLVRCNMQVHDFQEKVLGAYFARKEIPQEIYRDVIFFKETAVDEVQDHDTAVKVVAAAIDNYIETFCK